MAAIRRLGRGYCLARLARTFPSAFRPPSFIHFATRNRANAEDRPRRRAASASPSSSSSPRWSPLTGLRATAGGLGDGFGNGEKGYQLQAQLKGNGERLLHELLHEFDNLTILKDCK